MRVGAVGQETGARYGEMMARYLGPVILQAFELWVLWLYSRLSFDSRYFGAIEMSRVRARIWRLWTTGSDR